jgi:micrococcal nuclease
VTAGLGIAALALVSAQAAAPTPVARVVDGDTIVLASSPPLTVRVLGIDCPEAHANAKCFRDEREGMGECRAGLPRGRTAAARARELLAGGAVTLEPAKPGAKLAHDRYGRTLAYVRLADGRDFGLIMVSEGLCSDFGWKYKHPRGAEYVAAAGKARGDAE